MANVSQEIASTAEGNLSKERLLGFYRSMARIRICEEEIAAMVERKEIQCPVHLCIGQEAVAAGVCTALKTDDYMFGAHRSHGHYLAKGGDMKAMMAELLGKKTGCSKGRGGSMHLIAPGAGVLGTVPIAAATIPMAVGCGMASRLRGDGRVSVAFFGDGAMEEGVCHEAMNLAALWKLPVVFVCENNFYASHLNLQERRAKDNLDVSAEAQGVPAFQVDGNNVLEVYEASVLGVRLAREGPRPTFLECRTFRWRGHVGPAWDLDVGVTRKVDLRSWIDRDPMARLESLMLRQGVRREEVDRAIDGARGEVAEAVKFARESAFPDPQELSEDVVRRTRLGGSEA